MPNPTYFLKKGLLLLVPLVGGFALGGWFLGHSDAPITTKEATEAASPQSIWSCPMHPQITAHEAGNCPMCGMSLALLNTKGPILGHEQLSLSDKALALAEVSTTEVKKRPLQPTIHLWGRLAVNEKSRHLLSTNYAARVEKLYLHSAGEYVRKGQPVALLYAAAVQAAQEDFLQALSQKENRAWLHAAEQKLRDWGLTSTQIEDLKANQKASPYIKMRATQSGYLLRKLTTAGAQLSKQAALYEIADLSSLWLHLEAPIEDLEWIQKGMRIPFTVEGLDRVHPFEAYVEEINPILNKKTHNINIQAVIHRPDPMLRPEMYVESYLRPSPQEEGLLLPQSAVLWTGKRSVVYVVEAKKADRSTLAFREVVLGRRFGDHYLVLSGLKEGEEVITEGAVSVDATMQLRGKINMMQHSLTKETEAQSSQLSPPDTLLQSQLKAYFELTEALIDSNEKTAQGAAQDFRNQLQKSQGLDSYAGLNEQAIPLLTRMEKAPLSEIRTLYAEVSDIWIDQLPQLGSSSAKLYEVYCPMALNNQGARWLWHKKEVLNPYFGQSMLKCGRVVKTIKSKK